MTEKIDETDERIIEELKKDSRQSTADISRRTGIARMTVHERIKRLKEKGVIRKFSVGLDHAKLGRPTTAFILIAYEPGHKMPQRRLAEKISKLSGVYAVHIITGEWDILVKARAASIEEIGKLVVNKIRELEGAYKAFTLACFDTVTEEP
ncbi:MAG: Lrp/AsnC family transcriptional regulator [Candidatus Burarchaeum sp.]|nr:Lrp/AsnC family transcriptional regulator [Candidatus Burarchaeum sp.]MDO8339250.1 Lrp/AsnC family transcriptional regulator [Candidatus Burarchaeum sp.]